MLEIARWSLEIFLCSKCSTIFPLEIARIENSKSKIVLEIARIENFNARNARDRCFCRSVSTLVALFSQVAMIYNLEVRKFNFYWLGFARSSNTLLDAVPEASLLQSHAFFSSTGFSSIRSSEAAVASIREAAFPTTGCTAAPSASHHIWRGQPTHSCSIISFFRLDPQDLCASKSMK